MSIGRIQWQPAGHQQQLAWAARALTDSSHLRCSWWLSHRHKSCFLLELSLLWPRLGRRAIDSRLGNGMGDWRVWKQASTHTQAYIGYHWAVWCADRALPDGLITETLTLCSWAVGFDGHSACCWHLVSYKDCSNAKTIQCKFQIILLSFLNRIILTEPLPYNFYILQSFISSQICLLTLQLHWLYYWMKFYPCVTMRTRFRSWTNNNENATLNSRDIYYDIKPFLKYDYKLRDNESVH